MSILLIVALQIPTILLYFYLDQLYIFTKKHAIANERPYFSSLLAYQMNCLTDGLNLKAF